ncbi:MAG: hypothetical protein ACRDTF_20790 [Pseudonocardiaceae bacterium]
MPDGAPLWELKKFIERFDAWAELESPSDDLRPRVLEWVMSRRENPYQGVDRVSGFPNLWFGQIPNSDDGHGNVVVCSYWVTVSTNTVTCDNFGTLSRPL